MPYLQIIKGDHVGRVFKLDRDRMVVGRHPTCQIVLENAAISRQHAQISRNQGAFYVEDLRSRNATVVNNEAVRIPTELTSGDEIRICDVTFRFTEGSLPPQPAPAPPPKGDDPSAQPDNRGTIGIGIDSDAPVVSTEPGQSTILSRLSASSTSLRLDVRPQEKLRAVLALAAAVANVLRMDNVLDKALEALFELFPQADEGFVLLRNPTTGALSVDAARTRKGSDGVRVSRTIINHVLDEGEAVLSADATKDFDDSESVSQARIRSMMCVPLLGKDDVRRGMIQLATRGLASQFKQDDLEIFVAVASQVALAVDNSILHRELVRQRDLERELAFATQVQMGFLPRERPDLDGYEFYDYYEAALSVGGDYFDYITLPDGRIAFTLGDVAGKGVPAALLMARLCSAARYHLLSQPTPSAALGALNDEISDGALGNRFITFAMCVLDPATGIVSVGNAGHLPPIVRRASGAIEMMPVTTSGMPLGIKADQVFAEAHVPLEPGDALFLYTDGVTEAMNDSKDLYRPAGIAKFLETGPIPVEEAVEGLVVDVEEFSTAGAAHRDDLCIVAVRRLPV